MYKACVREAPNIEPRRSVCVRGRNERIVFVRLMFVMFILVETFYNLYDSDRSKIPYTDIYITHTNISHVLDISTAKGNPLPHARHTPKHTLCIFFFTHRSLCDIIFILVPKNSQINSLQNKSIPIHFG